PRSAAGRGGCAGARLPDAGRDAGAPGRGLLHRPAGAERARHARSGGRPGGWPHGLRGCARRHGRGRARRGRAARGGAAARDVRAAVSSRQRRASAILASELGLDPKATMGFAMALSEACQNIVEHAGTGGWVAVQAYHWRRKLARRVVVIAVADAGVGFRHSLEPTQSKRFGARWSDAAALEAALIQGVSRFRDPGRGQGLAGIRRYVGGLSGIAEGHRGAIEPVLAGHGLAALVERREGGNGELEALGAPEAAAALVDELVARRLAVRTPAGTIALTLA